MQERWFTDFEPSSRWPHYTRGNAGEVLPTPASPLGQKLTFEMGLIQGGAVGSCRTGLYEIEEYDSELPETWSFFGSYLYINLSNIRMQGVRNPAVTVEQLDTAFFGEQADVPPYEPHPDDEKPHLLPAIEAHTNWVLSCTEWPELIETRDQVTEVRQNRPVLEDQSDTALVERARDMIPWIRHTYDQHYVASSSAGIAPGVLAVVGEAVGDPTIPMRVLAGVGGVDSAQTSFAVWDLSRTVRSSPMLTAAFDEGVDGVLDRVTDSPEGQSFLRDWAKFIELYGARGPNEYEISGPSFETHPHIPLAALDRARFQSDEESPHRRAAILADERVATVEAVRTKLAEIADAELTAMFEGALVGGNMMMFRERTKTNFVRLTHEVRLAVRELGRRHHEAGNLADPGEIFMLTAEELDDFVADPGSFSQTLTQRMADWRELWDLEPPFFIRDGQVPPLSEWARKGERHIAVAQPGEVLDGVAGSPGTTVGRARIVLDSGDPGDLDPGDILVAPRTDSAWGPLFTALSGVVVNVGAGFSHAAIVSRELGLPCAVSVTDATDRIPDGALIELNGATGQVTVLQHPG
jgi:phosphohistidine swiveling domain-containing protein